LFVDFELEEDLRLMLIGLKVEVADDVGVLVLVDAALAANARPLELCQVLVKRDAESPVVFCNNIVLLTQLFGPQRRTIRPFSSPLASAPGVSHFAQSYELAFVSELKNID